jgi:hypothetical protein
MTHLQPAFDGTELAAPAPAVTRRTVDDYEAWVDEVWNAFVDAADTGKPFTVSSVAADKNLPDPPKPQYQWGHLPERLLNAGIIRAHSVASSRRGTVNGSLVREWIGVPAHQRELVARHRAEARKERIARRVEQRKAAAA